MLFGAACKRESFRAGARGGRKREREREREDGIPRHVALPLAGLQVPTGTLSVSVHEGTNVEELKQRMADLVVDRYGVQLPPEPFGNEFVRDR